MVMQIITVRFHEYTQFTTVCFNNYVIYSSSNKVDTLSTIPVYIICFSNNVNLSHYQKQQLLSPKHAA